MSNPQILSRVVIQRSGSTLYDLKNIAEIIDVNLKLNEIGDFYVTLPAQIAGKTYKYSDVALFDDVIIYLGKGHTLSPNPICGGKINKITGEAGSNVSRTFHGKTYAEVLERCFLTQNFMAVYASAVATEIGSLAGLNTASIVVDATNYISENYDGISYLEILNRVSDFWFGSAMIQRDWFVDASKNLLWAARPFRTSGVETITFGRNMLQPTVYYDLSTVKNYIQCFGAAKRTEPLDVTIADPYTEALTGWAGTDASIALSTQYVRKGIYGIYITETTLPVPAKWSATFTMPLTLYGGNRKDGYGNLHFFLRWRNSAHAPLTINVELIMDVGGDSFIATLPFTSYSSNNDQWVEYNLGLGPDQAGDPTQTWQWNFLDNNYWNSPIQAVKFTVYLGFGSSVNDLIIDDFYFNQGHFRSGVVSDAGSITAYGQRDAVEFDDKLCDDGSCLNRALSFLNMYRYPITRIDWPMPLNLNVLPSDRLTLSVPNEGIVAYPFDVINVHHTIRNQSGLTQVQTSGSVSTRRIPAINQIEALIRNQERVVMLNRGVSRAGHGG